MQTTFCQLILSLMATRASSVLEIQHKPLNVISNEYQRTFVYQLRSTLVKGDIPVRKQL